MPAFNSTFLSAISSLSLFNMKFDLRNIQPPIKIILQNYDLHQKTNPLPLPNS
jgi:hypothetical protein